MLEDLKPGTLVDERYEIISLLSDGGMGAVYKARELHLDRLIAVKFLHAALLSDKESLLRFEREGQISLGMNQANILRCYHYGLWRRLIPYIAMEYLQGESLRFLLAVQKRFEWKRALKIACQICDGLSYAHKSGVIHRDIKPSNIFVLVGKNISSEEDQVKLLDFGLARFIESDPELRKKLTKTGLLLGTPEYMSPEQCMGKRGDHRADLYALACVIYEMISGQHPFQSDSTIGYLHQHVTEAPPSLSRHLPEKDIPPGLELVLQKGLQKDPDKRFQSAVELKEALMVILEGNGAELKEVIEIPEDGRKPRARSFRGTIISRWVEICLLTVGVLVTLYYGYSMIAKVKVQDQSSVSPRFGEASR